MNILGWFLAVCGVAGLVYGLRMMLKMKKLGGVPFKVPSQIAAEGAAAADAKGLVSTEGVARLPEPPLVAPMSGQPCIGYEITVERRWEKHVQTERGLEKRTGTSKVHGEYKGSFFPIGDGQGAVLVDATTQPDSEYEKTHASTITVGVMVPGTLTFGQLQMNTPVIVDLSGETVAFVGTEKVLKASTTMYALGELAPGPHGLALAAPKGIGTGKLIVHHQGREKLLGKTKRTMVLGYALGGALFVAGVPLGLLGPKPAPSAELLSGCAATIAGELTCEDRMYDADGKTYAWKVTEPGTYSIELKQPALANAIDGVITVTDAAGKQVAYDDGGSADKNAHVVAAFAPGSYSINVRDFGRTTVTGGYGYAIAVKKQGPAVAATPITAATAVAAATPPATPHALPPPKGPKGGLKAHK